MLVGMSLNDPFCRGASVEVSLCVVQNRLDAAPGIVCVADGECQQSVAAISRFAARGMIG